MIRDKRNEKLKKPIARIMFQRYINYNIDVTSDVYSLKTSDFIYLQYKKKQHRGRNASDRIAGVCLGFCRCAQKRI